MKDGKRHFSIRARGKSFAYAFRGLRFAVRTQHNLWIDMFFVVIVVGLMLWLGLGPVKCAIIVGTMGFVLSIEVLNTAVEVLVDLVSPEWNARAAQAKDVAAAAVLLSAIASAIIGVLVLGPPLLEKLKIMF